MPSGSSASTRVVQGALNQFPASLGGPEVKLATNGICGSTTIAAIKRLQMALGGQKPDGRVDLFHRTHHALATGPDVLRLKYRVGLHFRSLAMTQVSFDRHLRSTHQVYDRCGITIEMKSAKSLHLSEADARRFKRMDGTCEWEITSGEYADLQRLSSDVSSSEIVVFYVDGFDGDHDGCGGHLRNRPACIVGAATNQWVTAHEVGHVLLTSSFLPVHHASHRNLMNGSVNGHATPFLNLEQVAQIKRSRCCVVGPR